jgi:uncharacterized membrane-anchored protein YhcB (DUF1043 family)
VEYLDSVWQIGIIALVAGVMIGALAYRLLAPSIKQADQIKSELDTARDELDSYKASVGQHFNKTSELVNDLFTSTWQRVRKPWATVKPSIIFWNSNRAEYRSLSTIPPIPRIRPPMTWLPNRWRPRRQPWKR